MSSQRASRPSRTVPVIDLFAGPGGLGEGFSQCDPVAGARFGISLSVEMEQFAHQTLELRAFKRQFAQAPSDYWELLRGGIDKAELFRRFPDESAAAANEARRITLSARTAGKVRTLVSTAIGGTKDWVLIGGPPCQAYSLVGRARNVGRADYDADKDSRHVLYLEYLQLLAEHAPPVFVMENVKGLLSAKYRNKRMFDRIRADLQSPSEAIARARKSARPKKDARYRLISLSPYQGLLSGDDPADFLLRAEDFGVPQARHRVIIVGLRMDRDWPDLRLSVRPRIDVDSALSDLPQLRSGITDRDGDWSALLSEFRGRSWLDQTTPEIRRAVLRHLNVISKLALDRGNEFVPGANRHCRELGGWTHHATRAHIVADLERYLFASVFAEVNGRSPTLSDFPPSLLPNHENVQQAINTGHFSDRFRVQVGHRPSSTITSHISKDGHYYIHPDPNQCRSLTVREAARLQTFPDDYFFCGPRTAQYHQVGNAVPPRLARQIGDLILPLLAAGA